MPRSLLILAALTLCLALAAPGLSSAAPARGKVYVIGLGPCGPATATLQAVDTIKKMDAVVSEGRHIKLFADYVGNTPVWFDHTRGLWDYHGKFFAYLNAEDMKKFKAERKRITQERLARIEAFLAQGKSLGILEGGNACVFSSSHWYTERMDPKDVVYIAGLSSGAVAMNALGRSVIPAHDAEMLVETSPYMLGPGEVPTVAKLKELARFHPTLILYMALKRHEDLFQALGQAFDPATPCAVVFYAGYPDKQRIVRGTIADMPAKLKGEKERYLSILLVGRFLEGKPYLASTDKD